MPYDLPSTNITTLEGLLVYEAQQIPILFPMILFLIYVAIAGSGFFYQDKKTGRGNLAMWSSISGLITSTLSFILFLIPGLINLITLVIVVSVTLISAIWFIFESKE